MGSSRKPRMDFQRYGSTYQLRLASPEDLAQLLELSESHWIANSAPVEAFACDDIFLKLVDTDVDDRVRCDEVRAAVAWMLGVLANHKDIDAGVDTLRLDHLNLKHRDSPLIRSAAERILINLNKSGANEISLADVRNTQNILSAADANGDGIIPSSAAKEPEIVQFIENTIATVGGETDAGGGTGVTKDKLKQFIGEVEAYLEWHDKGRNAIEEGNSDLMPLGGDTAAAYSALEAIRNKVDEYFRLCATVAYDEAAAAAFGLGLSRGDDQEIFEKKLDAAPIAQLRVDGLLDLAEPLNPAYEKTVQNLRTAVLLPLLGEKMNSLEETQWRQVCDKLAAHSAWQADKPNTRAAALGEEKLRQYLAPRFREAVIELVATDEAAAREIEAISKVERIILYQRWMIEFANNFVNFSRLYDPEQRALFEAGTLYMDGRRFTLCVAVRNRAAHARIAQNSRLFILYLQLTRGTSTEKMEVAAAVTSGGKGNLYVGKHGIFIDRDGLPWDAQVTQIIENPISFREALISPFRRMGTLVQSQIEKFSGSGEKLVAGKLTKRTAVVATSMQAAAQQTERAAPAAAAPPQQPQAGRGMRDAVVGGSIAFAALGSTLAYIAKTLHTMKQPGMLVAKVLVLIVLAMLLPMTINAWIKLRQRDIGTLLEACGWAINARMRLTRLMQDIFTRRPKLPAHARKQRFDLLRRYTVTDTGLCKWLWRKIRAIWKNIEAGV